MIAQGLRIPSLVAIIHKIGARMALLLLLWALFAWIGHATEKSSTTPLAPQTATITALPPAHSIINRKDSVAHLFTFIAVTFMTILASSGCSGRSQIDTILCIRKEHPRAGIRSRGTNRGAQIVAGSVFTIHRASDRRRGGWSRNGICRRALSPVRIYGLVASQW